MTLWTDVFWLWVRVQGGLALVLLLLWWFLASQEKHDEM